MLIFALSLLKLVENKLLTLNDELVLPSTLRFDPTMKEYPLHNLDPEMIFQTYKWLLKRNILSLIDKLSAQYTPDKAM